MEPDNNKFNWRRALIIAFDVITVLVFLFSLAISITTILSRNMGKKPAWFSLGVVQSKSMEASGIQVGDIMAIKSQKEEYKVGDIIAFVRKTDAYGSLAEKADLTACEVWVHEVIAVRTDFLGRSTYLTKGSSNKYDDGAYVPHDFVVGKATLLPPALNNFIKFLSSKKGIIYFVIIPCGLLLMYHTYVLVSEVYLYIDEKRAEEEEEELEFYEKEDEEYE